MPSLQESFEIAYCGVTIKITPVVNGSDMQFVVKLPTREVTIEPVLDEDLLSLWQEIPAGPTELAEAIGSIIEERDM